MEVFRNFVPSFGLLLSYFFDSEQMRFLIGKPVITRFFFATPMTCYRAYRVDDPRYDYLGAT